ncbi:GNAT family N-acetyltransferase [Macrococcoides bohemicum]|uniref:GNAT family N-acetyltransferase n=1 Tax=Macrococcoides bohemicum TaxID=1903056 RepID=UPI001C600314|nr:GNAT family N-acetyltransferase [Macrococcus bohemicus]QYA45727.1 GNAT family N-acetyltransferase [Macrococcus bohemicus]
MVPQIRLRLLTIDIKYAEKWYNNRRVLLGSEGINVLGYDEMTIRRMYNDLNDKGTVFIIEILDKHWKPIGDITLSPTTVPIIIGEDKYVGKGIAKRAMMLLLKIAKYNDYKEIKVSKVFDYNINSQKLFESLGFEKSELIIGSKDELYYQYHLKL